MIPVADPLIGKRVTSQSAPTRWQRVTVKSAHHWSNGTKIIYVMSNGTHLGREEFSL
jgi:hypothetical protein